HSSGGKRKLGSITKTGNVRARRLLIEGAQSYRHPANVSKEHQLRQEGLPKIVIDTAWKAQLRLCQRYQRLMQQGKHHNVIKVAIAREMAAYMWAIAKQIVLPAVDIRKRIARVPA
ncbi:transposase, partial [Alteromonas sp. W364]|uniref:transposase n=1 Tax=Alteromonas sp. W364 TaxID=3075610 RepID=UPI00288422AA